MEAEFLYQQGLPPQATYRFKHALIQEAAYQSLLKSTRQQHHQRIAQVLETQFPELVATQPELLAYHYTAAGLAGQAIPHWQRAGERASERSANVEAITHLTTGLEVLATLPETPTRMQQELDLQIALGPAFVVTRGPASPAVEQVYARAQELCQQVGETPQLFPVLWGLWRLYNNRCEYQRARALGERLLRLAQQVHDAALLLEAHHALWSTLLWSGEFAAARPHLEQGRALYDPQQHHAHALLYGGHDPGVCGLSLCGLVPLDPRLSGPGPAAPARGAHPGPGLGAPPQSGTCPGLCHHAASSAPGAPRRARAGRGPDGTRDRAGVCTARGTGDHHAGLGAARPRDKGQKGRRRCARAWRPTRPRGASNIGRIILPCWPKRMGAEDSPQRGCPCWPRRWQLWTALGNAGGKQNCIGFRVSSCWRRQARGVPGGSGFQQALDVARRQQAKSLELRAAMSLSRLWQQQGKRAEAYELLAPIYGWFTEGFDTADLQEAKALLEELTG